AAADDALSISASDVFRPGRSELTVSISLAVPAELTVSVFDAEGTLVRRLAGSQLTHPGNGVTRLYWDGRGSDGAFVQPGTYTVAAEALVGGKRRKAACNVAVKD
ncbi:MAG: hypothetical protein MR821_08610, partial [Clostridiales bacterium]|nr:hypothetical protein [Clostridiales bacterium]